MSKKEKNEDAVVAKEGNTIIVKDPQILRPQELPLVVEPSSGKWANDAQAEFARTLNGYAYKNPKKWDKKKDVLLKQLEDLASNPENLKLLVGGNNGGVSFTNKLLA